MRLNNNLAAPEILLTLVASADIELGAAPEPEDPGLVKEPLAGPSGNFCGAGSDHAPDPLLSSHVQFSAGDEPIDHMAESLARALHDAGLGGTWQGDDEHPLQEEGEAFDSHDDLFYCEGRTP